jgi:protein-disulfide isomerase
MQRTIIAVLPVALFLLSPQVARLATAAPGSEAPPAAADPIYRVPIAGLPSMGDARALVTVVAFTDYECPFCRRAEATLAALRASYGADLRVVVAERPRPMHPHAREAALFALAAGAEGAFEGARSSLFAAPDLSGDTIAGLGPRLGLDPGYLAAGRANAVAALAASEKLADGLNVRGTPTFFVNGRRIQGAQPLDAFKVVVDERLASARRLVATGVRPEDVYDASVAGGQARVPDDSGEGTCAAGCNGPDAPEVGEKVEAPSLEGAPSRGPLSAPITIVEFADFQCPYCAHAEATLRAIEEAHPGQVRVVWKDKALPAHDHARLYALAARAAGAQGRFWEMHDRLLSLEAPVDRAALVTVAGELGLDTGRFARDVDDPANAEALAAELREGEAMGVRGTPTFFVNGLRVVGAQPASAFERAIEQSKR